MYLDECLELNESCNEDLLDATSLFLETVDQLYKLEIDSIKAEYALSEDADSYLVQEAFDEAKEKVKKVGADVVAKFREMIDKIIIKWEKLQTTIQAKMLNSGKAQHIYNAARKSEKLKGKKWLTTAKVGYLEPNLINPVLQKIPVDFQRVAAKDLQGDGQANFEEVMRDLSQIKVKFKDIITKRTTEWDPDKADKFSQFIAICGGGEDIQKPDNGNAAQNQSKMGRMKVMYAGMDDLNHALQFLKLRASAVKSLKNISHTISSFKGRADKVDIKAYQRCVLQIMKIVNKATKASLRLFKEVRKYLNGSSIEKEKKKAKLVDKETGDKINAQKKKEAEEGHARGIHDESASILSQFGYQGSY